MDSGRRLILVASAAVLLSNAACSGSDPSATSRSTSSITVAGEAPNASALGDVASNERVTFEGVTLVVDVSGPIESVEGRAPDAGGSTDDSDYLVTFDVRLVGGAEQSELRIIPLRDVTGQSYPVSPSERARREVLEAAIGESLAQFDSELPDDGQHRLGFVGGIGARSISASADRRQYEFAGITTDDRFLVTFGPLELPEGEGADLVDALDRMIASLYIDGASAAFEPTCDDDALLVADLTIPDGSIVEPGSEIVKSWRLRNTGSCTWTDQYSWVLGGGDPVLILDMPEFGVVEPGNEIDLDVRLRVPVEAGVYTSQWELLPPGQRQRVGGVATIVFEVIEP